MFLHITHTNNAHTFIRLLYFRDEFKSIYKTMCLWIRINLFGMVSSIALMVFLCVCIYVMVFVCMIICYIFFVYMHYTSMMCDVSVGVAALIDIYDFQCVFKHDVVSMWNMRQQAELKWLQSHTIGQRCVEIHIYTSNILK